MFNDWRPQWAFAKITVVTANGKLTDNGGRLDEELRMKLYLPVDLIELDIRLLRDS